MTTQLADQLEKIEKMIAALPRGTDEQCREYAWKYDVLPRLRGGGWPPRFHKIATEWKPGQLETLEETKSLLKGNGAIVALIGPRGLGKTTIAAQIAIEAAMDEDEKFQELPWCRIVPYWKLSEMIARFKPIYADFGSKDGEGLIQRHKRLCSNNPLIVIDEIHVCEEQKIKNRLVIDTLDRRYANLKDSIIISNESPEEFQENTDPSILSRMKEHGCIIHCTWESWR